MKEKKTIHSKWLHIRFKESDFNRLRIKFQQSSEQKLSAWARKLLLEKPIIVKRRNQSLDDLMAEMITLKNDLNAIGNNYNQVVRKLNSVQEKNELQGWLMVNQHAQQMLAEKIQQIKNKIYSINEAWLRE